MFFDAIEDPSEEFDVISNVPAKMMGGQFHRLAWNDIVDHCRSNPAEAAVILVDLFEEDLGIVDRLNKFHEFSTISRPGRRMIGRQGRC